MNKPFHVLILGVETPLGQSILDHLQTSFPVLKVAVPARRYSAITSLSPYFLPVSLNSLSESFKEVRTVISCSSEYSGAIYREAAAAENCTFVDVSSSYRETVLESFLRKLDFEPKTMTAFQSARGISFWGFLSIARRHSIPKPRQNRGFWVIDQGIVTLQKRNNQFPIPTALEFGSHFFAMIFWVLAIIVRFISAWLKFESRDSSASNWRFIGVTEEHGQDYEFEIEAPAVEEGDLRPDLCVIKIVDALGVHPDEACDWPAFERLKLKFVSYTLKNE
jgi:hypothetical protein